QNKLVTQQIFPTFEQELREILRQEFDVQQLDRYKRLLAYVYLEDGTFVNAWLVEHGYAQVMTISPNVKHQELFLKLQREAREGRRGLWGRRMTR
ncbi:MAG: thermonuclease family protein, partial [Candidatus Binatia bacterium]